MRLTHSERPSTKNTMADTVFRRQLSGRAFLNDPDVFLLRDENTKLTEEKDLGINGIVVDAMICKSRTGRAGRSCTLVFDYDRGFDPDLSMYQALKAAKIIDNSGAYYTIKGYPDIKFLQKNFKEKLKTDPDFALAFKTTAIEYLKSMINTDDVIAAANAASTTMTQDILADINAGM